MTQDNLWNIGFADFVMGDTREAAAKGFSKKDRVVVLKGYDAAKTASEEAGK